MEKLLKERELFNKEVRAIGYDVIGGYYDVGDILLIKGIVGSYYRVLNTRNNYTFHIRGSKIEFNFNKE